MALSLVYGFYVFFLEGPAQRPHAETTSKLDTFNKFITTVADLTKDGLSEIDAYIIKNISAKWTKDPLLKTSGPFDPPGGPIKELLDDVTYKGYLQMGSRHLAIINGSEYEAGDELELKKGNFTVKNIYPNRVILVLQGGKVKHSIPLEESQ